VIKKLFCRLPTLKNEIGKIKKLQSYI